MSITHREGGGLNRTPTVLGPRKWIEGRLCTINYPDDASAAITFGVFSSGHVFDGEHRLLAQISNGVELDDLRKDEFGRIVAVAARKLALDLSRLARRLYREYVG